MSTFVAVGVATALAIIFASPKAPAARSTSKQKSREPEGNAPKPEALHKPDERPQLPPGAIDFDEFRARKAWVRGSIDGVVLLLIVAAAAWVISRDYGWRPVTFVLEWLAEHLPREAGLLRDMAQGLKQVQGDLQLLMDRVSKSLLRP